ncbi:hypothetical protein CP532_4086 [Ophiocordyceps camponoti-leonardi (nom. inval.)]|nr:hypothetical protein CP532_4086 [Ophiocordyceps camponoti-leonardi (nom. inval.)]
MSRLIRLPNQAVINGQQRPDQGCMCACVHCALPLPRSKTGLLDNVDDSSMIQAPGHESLYCKVEGIDLKKPRLPPHRPKQPVGLVGRNPMPHSSEGTRSAAAAPKRCTPSRSGAAQQRARTMIVRAGQSPGRAG